MKRKIFLGIPTFDFTVLGSTVTAVVAAKRDKETTMEFMIGGFSGLTANFNDLFVDALNRVKNDGVTHFAMLHGDIDPEAYWLDKLVAIMEAWDADVVSAISPVKDNRGLTSTARENPDNPWYPIRYTMREVFKMAPTFSTAEVPGLLLNTGCMLIDLRKDWTKKICFRVENEIVQVAPGQFRANFMSEDWLFAREAAALGAKLVATREVKLRHIGGAAFDNHSAWGTLELDDVERRKNLGKAGSQVTPE